MKKTALKVVVETERERNYRLRREKLLSRREWQRKKRAVRKAEHDEIVAGGFGCPWPTNCQPCRRAGIIVDGPELVDVDDASDLDGILDDGWDVEAA